MERVADSRNLAGSSLPFMRSSGPTGHARSAERVSSSGANPQRAQRGYLTEFQPHAPTFPAPRRAPRSHSGVQQRAASKGDPSISMKENFAPLDRNLLAVQQRAASLGHAAPKGDHRVPMSDLVGNGNMAWSPQKHMSIETPPKLEVPSKADSDDTTPPKGVSFKQGPRRSNQPAAPQCFLPSPRNADVPRSKIASSRLDPTTSSQAVDLLKFGPGTIHASMSGTRDAPAKGPLRSARTPAPEPEIVEPSSKQQPTSTAALASQIGQATPQDVCQFQQDVSRRKALRDFSVVQSRIGKEASSCPLQELPSSVRNALVFVRNVATLPATPAESKRPVLPPMRGERPCLVLDLDETLAHCHRSSSSSRPPPLNPDLVVIFDDLPASSGEVLFRPYVHEFLEAAAEVFEVVVFTASKQSYADKVINALDPNGTLIHHRLYRQHCTEYRGAFFKELQLLGRPLHNWYGEPLDTELKDLLLILKEMTQHRSGDCRMYLAGRYGLRDFFEGLRESVRDA